MSVPKGGIMTKRKLTIGSDLAGTLDDPNHDWELGCTQDPQTCENLVICLCEEEQYRLEKERRENEKK